LVKHLIGFRRDRREAVFLFALRLGSETWLMSPIAGQEAARNQPPGDKFHLFGESGRFLAVHRAPRRSPFSDRRVLSGRSASRTRRYARDPASCARGRRFPSDRNRALPQCRRSLTDLRGLVSGKPRHAHCGAQFRGFGRLRALTRPSVNGTRHSVTSITLTATRPRQG
jgi:hypothetical protein